MDEWQDRYDEKQRTDERAHERQDNVRIQERHDNECAFKETTQCEPIERHIVTAEELKRIFDQIERQNQIKRQLAIVKWVQNHKHLLTESETK